MPITAQQYGDFDRAYQRFNDALFDGKLPDCFITINRQANSAGYFRAGEFVGVDGKRTDEISLNYRTFLTESVEYVLSTLAHEMCHQWQRHHGKPSRTGHHNKEWADKMEGIGLMPSSTGQPGGKRTGQKMSDYPIENGLFRREVTILIQRGFDIRWGAISEVVRIRPGLVSGESATGGGENNAISLAAESVETVGGTGGAEAVPPKPKDPSKVKFSCPDCGQNAWAKISANLKCGYCDVQMHQ